jgi:parallel beta-helix repeat protein
MDKKLVFATAMLCVLIPISSVSSHAQIAQTTGIVYIRADGSVDPSTTPISTGDNVTYTLTENIDVSIVVERSYIIVDGAGHSLQGNGTYRSDGIFLSHVQNVTIRNMTIKDFYYNVHFDSSFHNVISETNITGSKTNGLWFYNSSGNEVHENNVTNNRHGILLSSSCENIVSNNSIENNHVGVMLYYYSSNNTVYGNKIVSNSNYGVEFWFSSNNVLSHNTLRGNGYGIWFDNSLNDSALDNAVTSNVYGICLFGAANDTLSENTLDNNRYSLSVDGVLITDYIHSIDKSNLVNGKPIYYLINQHNLAINNSTYPQVGYLALVNSTDIRINDLTLANSGQGLLLDYTDNSVITNNRLSNNDYGILVTDSKNDTICGNDLTSNTYGLVLDRRARYNFQSISNQESDRNKFYHNNFINNTEQAQTGGGDSWDNGYPSGGNYWSDYNGTDAYSGPYQNETGYDWIGDTPYVIDRYPLMRPYSPETDEIRIAYRTLLGNCNALAANLSTLNSAYQQNLLDYYSLRRNYTSLQNSFNSLNTSFSSLNSSFISLNSAYDNLRTNYQTLSSSYNNLNTTFNDYKISTENELSYIRNFVYVFTATTAIFIAATIYFAVRKPKIRTKAEKEKEVQ